MSRFDLMEPFVHHLGAQCSLTGRVNTRQPSPEPRERPSSSVRGKSFRASSALGIKTGSKVCEKGEETETLSWDGT